MKRNPGFVSLNPGYEYYSYLPHVSTIACGLLIGFFDSRGIFIKGAALAALISVTDGIIPWIAAQAGLTMDLTTVGAIAVMSMLEMLFCMPLILIGGLLGWGMNRLVE